MTRNTGVLDGRPCFGERASMFDVLAHLPAGLMLELGRGNDH
jgi:hypothetical protein